MREADKIPHDKKVSGILHPLNYLKLVVQTLSYRVAHSLEVSLRALIGKSPQVLVRILESFGKGKRWDHGGTKLKLEVTAFGNYPRVLDRLRNIGEEFHHLLRAAKVISVSVK